MPKTSAEFTRGLGQVLSGAKVLYDFGVEKGLTTPQELRLTVMARQEEAKKLVASGVSQRQAAKRLGVHHSTVQADLGGKSAKSGGKSANGRKSAQEIEILEKSEIKKAEAKLSTTRLQHIMLDRIFMLLAELTPSTLEKFKRRWEEEYGKK
jgi:transposase